MKVYVVSTFKQVGATMSDVEHASGNIGACSDSYWWVCL